MKIQYYKSRNHELNVLEYLNSKKALYARLLECDSIEEIRIILDIQVLKLAVQEWLYFIITLSMSLQHPGRYRWIDSGRAAHIYSVVADNFRKTPTDDYLDRIFLNTSFVKNIFMAISKKDTLEFKNRIFLVYIFQLMAGKYPDLLKWNFFAKRRRKLDFILKMNCSSCAELVDGNTGNSRLDE